jgi:hypothetical protein
MSSHRGPQNYRTGAAFKQLRAGHGPRARPIGRPGTARNSNGPVQPEIQTIQNFSDLDGAGPGDSNVHL